MWRRYYNSAIPTIDKAISKYFPANTPNILTLVQRTELIFVNTHRAMGFHQPRVPSVIEFSGMHIKPPKPLRKEIEEFIGDDDFIYFSLGSVIPESTIREDTYKGILNTFRKLNMKILWKWDGSQKGMPKNVLVSKWFSQQDILGKNSHV